MRWLLCLEHLWVWHSVCTMKVHWHRHANGKAHESEGLDHWSSALSFMMSSISLPRTSFVTLNKKTVAYLGVKVTFISVCAYSMCFHLYSRVCTRWECAFWLRCNVFAYVVMINHIGYLVDLRNMAFLILFIHSGCSKWIVWVLSIRLQSVMINFENSLQWIRWLIVQTQRRLVYVWERVLLCS